ncbi:MAG: hypothetical protein RL065_2096 [Bacteroidota bacterium]|jgi:hypothetical protein
MNHYQKTKTVEVPIDLLIEVAEQLEAHHMTATLGKVGSEIGTIQLMISYNGQDATQVQLMEDIQQECIDYDEAIHCVIKPEL